MRYRLVSIVVVAIATIGVVCPVSAGFVQKDSSDFTYKYEMDVEPSEADLNTDSVPDFYGDWGASVVSHAVSGGILTVKSSAKAGDACYINATDFNPDQTWTGLFTDAGGWTIESRVKIISDAASSRGAMNIMAGTATSPAANLGINSTGQNWGAGTTSDPVGTGTYNNTDAFHTFRISLLAGTGTYNVWRDQVLLTPTPLAATTEGIWDAMYFPDGGAAYGGEVQIDYVRYIGGSFAPVGEIIPEPSSIVILFSAIVGLLAYAWRKRK